MHESRGTNFSDTLYTRVTGVPPRDFASGRNPYGDKNNKSIATMNTKLSNKSGCDAPILAVFLALFFFCFPKKKKSNTKVKVL